MDLQYREMEVQRKSVDGGGRRNNKNKTSTRAQKYQQIPIKQQYSNNSVQKHFTDTEQAKHETHQ